MEYDKTNYVPPAPSLQVVVSNPYSKESRKERGKVDTGADISVIPSEFVPQLGLAPARRLLARAYDRREGFVITYYVDLAVQEFAFELVEVVAAPRSDILLGRDILNRLKMLLDGKALTLELQDP
jgi:predicted aspartyl protease